MKSIAEEMLEGASSLNIKLEPYQVAQFEKYAALLQEWNEKINLTRVAPEDYASRHFIDSLLVASTEGFADVKTLVDIGTGGGFPGIPLKIAFPNLRVTLLDSVNKKIVFVKEVVSALNLENVACIHGRAEELGRDPRFREAFDVVTARAVAELRVLVEISLPLVKKGGKSIFLKGIEIKAEAEAAKSAVKELGGRRIEIFKNYSLRDATSLVLVEKTRATSDRYPRPYRKISAQPL